MSCETALIIHVLNETATEGEDGLAFSLHGRDAEETPAPVVYVDGAEADAEEYTFDCGDEETNASITFTESQSGKAVTCDYYWRLECAADQDLTVYEFGRELNAKALKDVNGRTMVVEGYEKTTSWRGALAWEYATQEFWDEIRLIAEGVGTTFDLSRASLAPPFDRIERLYPLEYPKFREIPGVPGRSQISITAVQLT
jgi:hypothetical protein